MKVAVTRSGTIVSINEVANGRSCKCACFECGEPVLARQGHVRDWHFAHDAGTPPCEVNPESLLHRFVKQVITEERALMVPLLPARLATRFDAVARMISGGWLNFEATFEEVWMEGRRPDIVGVVGGEKVLIEVAYTHRCGYDKIDFLNAKGWLTLEIDVSCFGSDEFDPSAVRHWLQTNLQNKEWLQLREPETVLVPEIQEVPLSLLPATPVVAMVDQAPPKKTRPELLLTVIIEGRPVTLKRLPFGDLALRCEYGREAVNQVRYVAKRFGGDYKDSYKNWLIPGCFEVDVIDLLKGMHNEASLWAGR